MSFMKKVAKVAAPFASLIPGVGPFIGAGLGALGSIGGGGDKKLQQQALAQQSQFQQQLMGSIGTQQKMSQGLIDKGMPLIDQGAGATGQSLDFFRQLLSGKSNMALAGPISDLRNASNNALRNAATFGPRSAYSSSLVDRTNQLGQSIARLRADSMTGAANSLLQGGGQLLGAGSNLATGGLQSYGNTLSTLLGVRGQDISQNIAQQQISSSNMQGLGQGLGSILGILLQPGGIFNKGGGIFGSGGVGGGRTPTTPPFNGGSITNILHELGRFG